MSTGPVQPLDPQQTAQAEQLAAQEGYLKREAVALDTFVDETADGPMGITISTRWGDWAKNKKGIRGFIGRLGCRALNLIQRNHDAKAAAGDMERAQEAEQYIEKTGLIDAQKKGN